MSDFHLIQPGSFGRIELNWKICFICQQNTSEELIIPPKKQGMLLLLVCFFSDKQHFHSIAGKSFLSH